MGKLWRVLGYAWASPATLFGLFYVTAFTVAGWYRWYGVRGDALVWLVNADRCPAWLTKPWLKWGGHTLGQVVVLKYNTGTYRGKALLVHETEHVHQFMKLGVFQPIMYALIYVSIKLCCESADPFLDHSFEVSARRRAGQVVDVIGALVKMKTEGIRVADLKK